jgi:hypothetical protein
MSRSWNVCRVIAGRNERPDLGGHGLKKPSPKSTCLQAVMKARTETATIPGLGDWQHNSEQRSPIPVCPVMDPGKPRDGR